MKKTLKRVVVLVTLLILLTLYLVNAKLIVNNIIDYSLLFLTKLFPVSFIFFVFSTLFINYGLIESINTLFNINSSKLYVFCLSLISGFPAGAKYTEELLEKELISVSDANKIIMFSHFPNPLFVLGSVGSIFNDNSLVIKVLISIIISNFIIFLFCGRCSKTKIINRKIEDSFSDILSKAINNSFQTIFLIYGVSLFFYLISSIITKYIFINTYFYVLLNGVFDLTKGVFSTTLINSDIIKALFILVFISFGGISIHMQINSLIINSKIKYMCFVIGRIISTVLALGIFLLLINI